MKLNFSYHRHYWRPRILKGMVGKSNAASSLLNASKPGEDTYLLLRPSGTRLARSLTASAICNPQSALQQGGAGVPASHFGLSLVTRRSSRRNGGFTMMEIAISLAIIGIALVAIIGVLPIGMNTQQDNRQETIIGEDANVLIEDIRNGALGANDLTNYIYAITNYWAQYNPNGNIGASGVNGYTYQAYSVASGYPRGGAPLTNGANIIGLLTTPEFIGASGDAGRDAPGQPIPSLFFGGISNHIVAYVYSISGPAAEKPPQDNQLMQQDSFSYRVYCVNAPMAINTNDFFIYPNPSALFMGIWSPSIPYPSNAIVFEDWTYWSAPEDAPADANPVLPSRRIPPYWQIDPDYSLESALNTHELRLSFEWPQLPNGSLGSGRQTFRTMVAGGLQFQPPIFNSPVPYNTNFYVYQSQSFTNSP